ncbi:MAG: 3-oxoacyl-ACP reductase FabG [Thermodesulfobacteriota bacterium]
MTNNNSKPTVLVTGGSRGIGAAISRRLARSGYDIWLNYRSGTEAAEKVLEDVEKEGGNCRLLQFDVSQEAEIKEVLEPLLEEKTPYGFIHNAGITRDGLLALMPTENWDAVLNVHLRSFFLLSRLLIKPMLSERKGRIVAVSSVAGETGQSGQVNYSAAKAGMIGAVKALARETARRNIQINVVSPGFIETDMIRDLPMKELLKSVPARRAGRPEEVAGAVNFLMSEEAGYITGQVLGVNGGLYM